MWYFLSDIKMLIKISINILYFFCKKKILCIIKTYFFLPYKTAKNKTHLHFSLNTNILGYANIAGNYTAIMKLHDSYKFINPILQHIIAYSDLFMISAHSNRCFQDNHKSFSQMWHVSQLNYIFKSAVLATMFNISQRKTNVYPRKA